MMHPGRLARTIETRDVRRAQLGIALGLSAAVAGAYLFNADVQAETGRALAVLSSGNGHAVGDYLLGFGVWAPIACGVRQRASLWRRGWRIAHHCRANPGCGALFRHLTISGAWAGGGARRPLRTGGGGHVV